MSKPLIQIADAFAPLFKPKRFKVFFGGRGGAKSWAFAQALEAIGTGKELRVLCTREFQGSIQESVHKLLTDTANRFGMGDFYDVQQASIKGQNGTNFIFEGIKRNTTKIKSMEGIDIVWCEEAESITELSWDLLIPTIRKDGSEVWISFNPEDEQDPTYQRFVAPYMETIEKQGFYEDDQIYVAKVGWEANPWFPEELRREMLDCKKKNFQKYLHIWEGFCNQDYKDSIIKPEWVQASIDAHEKLGFKAQGIKAMGFDPADEGEDAKAYCYRHGVVVEDLDQWDDGDVDDATDRVVERADELRCNEFVYDAIGIGSSVKTNLKHKAPKADITRFVGSESVRDPESLYMEDRKNEDVFRNLRSQYWWFLRDRFEKTYRAVEKGEYSDPDELISLSGSLKYLTTLKSELCRVRRKRGLLNSRILLESKQEMKSRGVSSPNMADALVMAFANPIPDIYEEPFKLNVGHII